MAADGTSIKQDIDTDLGNKGYKGIRIATVIMTLKKVVDWVAGAVNGSVAIWNKVGTNGPAGSNTDDVYRMGKVLVGRGADDGSGQALQVTSANIDTVSVSTLNGVSFNRDFGLAPSGLATFRYFKVAQLQASSGGLRDIVRVSAVLGLFSSNARGRIDALFGNRDSFSFQYTIDGDPVDCGMVAYSTGGVVTVFLKVANDFRCGVVDVQNAVQASVFPTLPEMVPTGQLVFDSTDQAAYPAVRAMSVTDYAINRNVLVSGFIRAGSGNRPFKLTGVKPASGLTLKTSRYLELLLDDGTIVKVAEVN